MFIYHTQESFNLLNQSLCNIFNIEYVEIYCDAYITEGCVIESPFAGHSHTEESKALMSRARRGKDNGKRKGTTNSPEHRRKISEAHKGKRRSAEARLAISNGKRGIPKSKEHCANISKSKKRIPLSVETRARMSEVRKGKPKPKFVCLIHNKKELDKANYTKWLAREGLR